MARLGDDGRSPTDGVLNVNKPSGPTSHDVVAEVRRIFGQKKVGHTGTLDPMAEGVLVVCLGRATRLVQYLVCASKQYRATMVLGKTTDSQDSTGQVIECRDAGHVTREALLSAAESFVGEIEQVPPMVSAIKHQGRRLYELARRGETVEREPRRVTIHALDLLDFRPGALAEAEIMVTCSSGTYIRTLCADIGEKLGCGAHMASLVRTRVGRFALEDSVGLANLADTPEDMLSEHVIGFNDALRDMPSITLDEPDANAFAHGIGVRVQGPLADDELIAVFGPGQAALGIGSVALADGERVVNPKTVLVG